MAIRTPLCEPLKSLRQAFEGADEPGGIDFFDKARLSGVAGNVASDSIVQPIAIRARALRQELQPWSELGSVQVFGEHLRAQLWSPAALEG